VDDLARLQRELIEAAARLVRPGGHLIYSVCTVTRQESIDHPIPEGFHPLVEGEEGFMELPSYWKEFGHGWRVLPHEADTDGMILLRYRRCA
jgi:16S rRNA (cytosine967-C5)-methyltransferase